MDTSPQTALAAEAATDDMSQLTCPDPAAVPHIQRLAVGAVARFHGVELHNTDLGVADDVSASPAALAAWARRGGLWAKATRLSWEQLLRMEVATPVVLVLNDGSTLLMLANDVKCAVVWVRHSRLAANQAPLAVDRAALAAVWNGSVVLLRARRDGAAAGEQFSLSSVIALVRQQGGAMRDVILASLVLSLLTVLPPLFVMTVVDQVIVHQTMSTLVLLSILIGVALLSETLLGYARRQLILAVGARVDARLNLQVFQRLLRLPLDYFERNQAGTVWSNTGPQMNKIREFLTGKLLATMLDMVTLVVLLPILFYLQPVLSVVVLASAMVMAGVIAGFMQPMQRRVGRWIKAESDKSSVMVETLHGIRTVKSLALEPQQQTLWDTRVAEATQAKLAAGTLANLTQAITTPIEGFMQRGVLLIGAYMALVNDGSVAVGSLVAFMMLSGRVAQPLAGLARLMENVEEVRTATKLAGSVLNQRPETDDPAAGLRAELAGAVRFSNVSYAYPGAAPPALNGISLAIRPGSTVGIVGRSGSGKSTLTRLLQGIARDYAGQVSIDGHDLKSLNLTHLRRALGVVLQENFLFRGTIRENILAGRPGLTLADAVRAAQLAGAAEFIEKLPNGYETFIEEGSPNLSGGQRQRLAIARALVHDPRILILDEATSALDPDSEAVVNANLRHIARGRTMVIVSHRLSSLVGCDQILVLDQGRVMDAGTHEELLGRCGTYRQLWLQQNRHLAAQPVSG
ncbi:MAG TPA: peptidase domain-containing ABC transporter [Rhodopila sp.]|nr:peptidase domain-containing ABC transporter [Rhodopila sp.]